MAINDILGNNNITKTIIERDSEYLQPNVKLGIGGGTKIIEKAGLNDPIYPGTDPQINDPSDPGNISCLGDYVKLSVKLGIGPGSSDISIVGLAQAPGFGGGISTDFMQGSQIIITPVLAGNYAEKMNIKNPGFIEVPEVLMAKPVLAGQSYKNSLG